jgi:hypothetical protein
MRIEIQELKCQWWEQDKKSCRVIFAPTTMHKTQAQLLS